MESTLVHLALGPGHIPGLLSYIIRITWATIRARSCDIRSPADLGASSLSNVTPSPQANKGVEAEIGKDAAEK
ncbi:hypothetical protein PoB_004013500 [Plakobranchus ocellatus]|uniref:Uncharacterized protein n=1 Tax=Plakobranchus ocellatus TaxID=259542 RepID=A0AAV4AZ36_9GAST|nr:hypothetical protein PoB_004013500 [Plakobranchus ocellatus]